MTLFSPAPRPSFPTALLPGTPPRLSGTVYPYSTEGPSSARLARKLLRTGQFPTVSVQATKPITAGRLLRQSAALLSDSLSDTCAMEITEHTTETGDEAIPALLVRFNTVLPYSLYASRARYDRACKGLLGRLLADLVRAAAPLVPMFTPTVYTETDDFDSFRNEELVYEAVTGRYPGRPPEEYTAIIEKLSTREQAKLAARHGATTYLDFHHVGATLGLRKLFTPEDETPRHVRALPDDLRRGALRARALTAAVHALKPNRHDEAINQNGVMDEDWGHLVYLAFLVIAGRNMGTDPLSEYLEEQWQMASEYGNTWPQLAVRLDTVDDHVRVARMLRRTCRTLVFVREALLSLGAELC